MATYNPDDEIKQAQFLADLYNKKVDTESQPTIDIYNRQIAGAANEFNPYRNAIEVQSRIDAKTLNEQMANTGLTRSGTNLTSQTALVTGKQNAQTAVNKQQANYTQQIRDQLNAVISQREAAKQGNLAATTAQAYQNVSQYKQSVAMAEINQNYAKENARINQEYNVANMRLNDQLTSAREDKNFAREAELTKQQNELNRQHDINISNLNAQHAAEQQRIDNEAAAQRQAADNAAAMARTQYSATRSGDGGYINPKTGKEYPDTVASAINAVNSGHNSSAIMLKGLEIYDAVSLGQTTKASALEYVKQNYGTGQINRTDLDYLLLSAGFNPTDVEIKVTPTGRNSENMQNRY